MSRNNPGRKHHVTHLQLCQMLWPLVNVHAAQANANSSRGDDDDPVAIFAQLASRVDDERQNGQQRLMRLFVHNGARAYARRSANAIE